MDVKIMLSIKGFINAINEPNPETHISFAAKFATLHFLRHHPYSDLKNEYMMEEDPRNFLGFTQRAL
jgi:hypothetical protein